MTRKEMNKDTTEYEKDLSELKEQILKEGNTLLTKRDLLERFCEIDKEYNGGTWNLLQILANINILIGQEPQTGHWIDGHCSECGCDVPAYIIDYKWQKDMDAKYCPNCGAKMIGSRERSDKE